MDAGGLTQTHYWLDDTYIHNQARHLPQLSQVKATFYTDRSNMRHLVYQYLARAHYNAFRKGSTMQWPYSHVNRAARMYGLSHCVVYADPPRYVLIKTSRRRIYDRYGRLLYMPPSIPVRKVFAADFAPMVQFHEMYPQHPDPLSATHDEKRDRVVAYLDMYANSGMITASARAVGVSYLTILVWINEEPAYQEMAKMANLAARQVMVDIGKQRAMQGNDAMLRFFIERENPDYANKKAKGAGDLPDGVTHEAISSAMKVIQDAHNVAMERSLMLPIPGTSLVAEVQEGQDFVLTSMEEILDLVNQTSRTLNPSDIPDAALRSSITLDMEDD